MRASSMLQLRRRRQRKRRRSAGGRPRLQLPRRAGGGVSSWARCKVYQILLVWQPSSSRGPAPFPCHQRVLRMASQCHIIPTAGSGGAGCCRACPAAEEAADVGGAVGKAAAGLRHGQRNSSRRQWRSCCQWCQSQQRCRRGQRHIQQRHCCCRWRFWQRRRCWHRRPRQHSP